MQNSRRALKKVLPATTLALLALPGLVAIAAAGTQQYPVAVSCAADGSCTSETSLCPNRFAITATTTGPLDLRFQVSAVGPCASLIVRVFFDGVPTPVFESAPLAPGAETVFSTVVSPGAHQVELEAECTSGTLGCWSGTLFVTTTTNAAPICPPSIDRLWPPNHELVEVGVLGVSDPDGDPVTIAISSVRQDEPASVHKGDACPDATGLGAATVGIRAESADPGDGRVYHLGYTATDVFGAVCSGTVLVCVPHDQREGGACVDQGPLYDSSVCP